MILTADKESSIRPKTLALVLAVLTGPLMTLPSEVLADETDPGAAGELYLVATAHLDTQWRWTIQETIADFIPATLRENLALLEKYPDYLFSFEGSFRYRLMQEYYPELFARMKEYVRQGRWRVCGSWVDAVDVNVPSPESLVRQTLYGNGYFRREFGVTSRDIYLPDCFGFGFALPSIAAHCGLNAFSTQKLTWGSAYGTPFQLGLWEGVDGSRLVAALDPDAYVSDVEGDLSRDEEWLAKLAEQKERSGVAKGLKYYGTGDSGGGPDDASAALVQEALTRQAAGEGGPIKLIPAAPDQLAADLTDEERAALPVYRGELLMTKHGAGCYTSQAQMKKWNRQNEILADAAERACVMAAELGGLLYPRETLRAAWERFLWHQFHDDLTGTSIPEAYAFSWNDELLSLQEFAQTLTAAVGAVAAGMDTRTEGTPVVVFNPLPITREDVVRVKMPPWPLSTPPQARVLNPDGEPVPAQSDGGGVSFLARVEPLSLTVFGVTQIEETTTAPVAEERHGQAENDRYRIGHAEDGSLVSIFDKSLDRELLRGPIALQVLDNEPEVWAAWEVDHADVMAEPREDLSLGNRVGSYRHGAVQSYSERGNLGDSEVRHRVALADGIAGDHLLIDLDIDWRSPGTLLKIAFPLAAGADSARYDLGLGSILRGVNTEKLYEVPAQRWVALTDDSGEFGVTIVSDSRYGWDRPDRQTLRHTLIHTPRVNKGWKWIDDQKSQDLGRHRVRLAIAGHRGDPRDTAPWLADRVNQPLLAFAVDAHEGPLGRHVSMLSLEQPDRDEDALPTFTLTALKKAEGSDEIVVRLQERRGESADDVALRFAVPVTSWREVNGTEEPLAEPTGEVRLEDGALICDLEPYRPRAFAIRLAKPRSHLTPPESQWLRLPHDVDGISRNEDRTDGDFDGRGRSLVGELLPLEIERDGVRFVTGLQSPGTENVTACRGQKLWLPTGEWDHVDVLAADTEGGRTVRFDIEGRASAKFYVPDHSRFFGQWDSRLLDGVVYHDAAEVLPGYVQPADVGWIGTHRHSAEGEDEPYVFTHVYRLRIPIPKQARSLTLPDAPSVRILAASAVKNPGWRTLPAHDLFEGRAGAPVEIRPAERGFLDEVEISLSSPLGGRDLAYRIDDGEPRRYEGPFPLTGDATVVAAHASPGNRTYLSPITTAAIFTRVEPRPAANAPASLSPGLACTYYEGAWRELPDFARETPISTGSVEAVTIPSYAREEDIGFVMTGWLHAPRRGLYRLNLRSDDGSALWLGDERMIDNDGLHGMGGAWTKVALEAGWHPIRIEFFQHLGGVGLELLWEGPDIDRGPVPATALSYEG